MTPKPKRAGPYNLVVSAHDSSQVEIKAVHKIPEGVIGEDEIFYKQKIYFFLPKSLGLFSENYSKEAFYRSLTNHIRVKTPRVLGDEEKKNCQIERILPLLVRCAANKEKPNSLTEAVNEVRLFGTYLNDQMKILLSYDQFSTVHPFFKNIVGLLTAYREVMDTLIPLYTEKKWAGLLEAFRYIDEYLSNRLEECTIRFFERGIDVREFIKPEIERRANKGYLQVLNEETAETSPETTLELFVYRMGRFKKYISELLYLEIKREKHDKVFTNIAAAFGAAFAAMVTALADPNQRTSISGQFFQSIKSSLPLMIGVVAGVYVFKDRMKELLRESLLSWFKPWLPDYSFKIRSRKGQIIGHCREEVHFIRSDDLKEEVLELRKEKSDIILPGDSFEDVISYSRHLTLNRFALENMFRNTNSLKDILRFDFNPFLTRLSNPVRIEHFFTKKGSSKPVELPKVYHVNLIVQHEVVTKATGQLAATYSKARIILDKNGIKRIEPLYAVAENNESSLAA